MGGSLSTDRMGDVPGYQKVWTSDKAIANILSLANVRKSDLFHIDYDQNSGSFKITHKKSGKVTLFQENKAGLHVAPLQHLTSEVQDNKDIGLAQTLDQNKQMYTKRQQERAEVAKALHESLLFPTIRDYKQIIRTNQIKNCPVTIEDIKVYQAIYGENPYVLKGKTVNKSGKPAVSDFVEVPPELKKAHQGIKLCANVMYIDSKPFLVTIFKNLHYITIYYLKDEKAATLRLGIDAAMRKYNKAGFEIKEFHADNQFECVRASLEDNEIFVNIVPAKAHQPDVERAIRLIKERFRALCNSLAFGMWPGVMWAKG